jgi:hypothetical protein
MAFIIKLFQILFAVYVFAFAGAAVGGFAGLMLAGIDMLEFQHVPRLMEIGAPLFVVWGFLGAGGGGSVEYYAPRKATTMHTLGSSDLFDDSLLIHWNWDDDAWRIWKFHDDEQ